MDKERAINKWKLFTEKEKREIKRDFVSFVKSDDYQKLQDVVNLASKSRIKSAVDISHIQGLSDIIKIDGTKNHKNKVLYDYKRIIYSSELKKVTTNALHALRGVYIRVCNCETITEALREITELIDYDKNRIIRESTRDENDDISLEEILKSIEPYIKQDSLTAWVNCAAETIRLTAGDIRSMRKGQKMKVILLDRNIGDYMHGTPIGTKYNPVKKGLNYATYTHDEGLTGQLYFDEIALLKENFTWEINGKAIGLKWFWTSIDDEQKPRRGRITAEDTINQDDIPDNVPVGWRGPAIRKREAKFLPKTVVHYGTWYDDYAPYRYDNLVEMK